MDERNIDVLGLPKSRWMGKGTTAIKGKMILHSVHTVRCVHSVAVVISHDALRLWKDAGSVFHPVSPQILRICIKLHMRYTTIIAAYAPTEPRTTTTEAATEAEAFYTLLKATVSSAPKKDRVIIVGTSKAVLEQTLRSGAVSLAVSSPENRIPTASDYLTFVPPMACSF